MLLDQPQNFGHVIDAALAKYPRLNQIAQTIERFCAEPEVRWRIPTGLCDTRAGLFGQNAAHGLAQQTLGDAVSDLERTGHPEHELDQTVIEERVGMAEAKGRAIAILGTQTARCGLAEDILIGAVL